MAKKNDEIEIEPENTNFISRDLIPPPPPKRKVTNMKTSRIFLLVSVIISLICGIGATVMYLQYYNKFHVWFTPIEGMCCFDPNLWVIIPLAFGVGFLIPAIAYVCQYL